MYVSQKNYSSEMPVICFYKAQFVITTNQNKLARAKMAYIIIGRGLLGQKVARNTFSCFFSKIIEIIFSIPEYKISHFLS